MEFDINKVYTAINAEELKIGSKCIFADTVEELEYEIHHKQFSNTEKLKKIRGKEYVFRFVCENNSEHNIAYLVELPECFKTTIEYKLFPSIAKVMEAIKKDNYRVKNIKWVSLQELVEIIK